MTILARTKLEMKNKIHFMKMAGAGNDFIVIEAVPNCRYKKMAIKMCDRTNGIGADGLLILDNSLAADYKMRIINADGSEAEMCGNGARCMAAYIQNIKKTRKKQFSMETLAGIIFAQVNNQIAQVQLTAPINYQPDIAIKIQKRNLCVHYIDTGVPHVIVFVKDLNHINVRNIGEKIRFHKRFSPRGANVNFVEQIKKNFIAVRTYERGVEDETKACGTGSVAAALIAYLKSFPELCNINNAHMRVKTTSQEVLDVYFNIHEKIISDVWLKGSTHFIAQGYFFLK